jgi:hypothetical protein
MYSKAAPESTDAQFTRLDSITGGKLGDFERGALIYGSQIHTRPNNPSLEEQLQAKLDALEAELRTLWVHLPEGALFDWAGKVRLAACEQHGTPTAQEETRRLVQEAKKELLQSPEVTRLLTLHTPIDGEEPLSFGEALACTRIIADSIRHGNYHATPDTPGDPDVRALSILIAEFQKPDTTGVGFRTALADKALVFNLQEFLYGVQDGSVYASDFSDAENETMATFLEMVVAKANPPPMAQGFAMDL